uniref:Uncharacterized protein n=1 Tax=Cyprinus carpio TaxID=7962 RepID=A0A8C1KQI4_CYPCA
MNSKYLINQNIDVTDLFICAHYSKGKGGTFLCIQKNIYIYILAGQRQQLQLNLSALAQAVEGVEQQASSEVTSRLASIRTDVRRMAGLEGEVELLFNQTQALEEKVAQTEKLMVKRIGDLLAGSIDRVSALRSSAEKSSQRLDQISALVQQLSAAHRELSERILALESGQAKLLKTATFASDLKPKVFSIRQDFAIIQPKLDDLTLRIGLLAEDLMSREEELGEQKRLFLVDLFVSVILTLRTTSDQVESQAQARSCTQAILTSEFR